MSYRKKMLQTVLLSDIADLIYHNASIDDLLTYLDRKKGLFRPYAGIKFLRELYTYTKSSEANLPDIGTKKIPYIIHLSSWGDRYSKKIVDFFLPSILATNNIPSISKEYNIMFWVHCDNKSASMLSTAPIINKLKEHAQVEISIIPEKILQLLKRAKTHWLGSFFNSFFGYDSANDWNYYLLGCLQNIAMRAAAKNKAYASILMPDNLLSDGAIPTLIERCKDKKVVVANMFRTSCEKIKDTIYSSYDNKEHSLSLSPRCINSLMVQNMHFDAQNRIVYKNNKNFSVSNQLIFSYPREIAIRSLIYHPVLINFSLISDKIPSNYLPIDNLFMSNAINESVDMSEQIYVLSGSYEMGIMEISDDNDHNMVCISRIKDMYKPINSMLNAPFWKKVNYYMFSKRYVFPIENFTNAYPLSDISEDEILNMIKQLNCH